MLYLKWWSFNIYSKKNLHNDFFLLCLHWSGNVLYTFSTMSCHNRGGGSRDENLTISSPECSFLISYSLFPALSFSFSPCSIAPSQAWPLTLARVMQSLRKCRPDKEHLCKDGPCLSSAPFAHLILLLGCLLVYTTRQPQSKAPLKDSFSSAEGGLRYHLSSPPRCKALSKRQSAEEWIPSETQSEEGRK